jgi:uncharacterized protein (DUF1810 family)
MDDVYDLNRFVRAQQDDYESASRLAAVNVPSGR